jgi:hypothetical protein
MTNRRVKNLSFFCSYSVVTDLRTVFRHVGRLGALVLGLWAAPVHAQVASASDLLDVAQACEAWAAAGFSEDGPFGADAGFETLFAAGPNTLYGRADTGMTIEVSRSEGIGLCELNGEGAAADPQILSTIVAGLDERIEEGQVSHLGGANYALCGMPQGLFQLFRVDGGEGIGLRVEWGTPSAWVSRGECVD